MGHRPEATGDDGACWARTTRGVVGIRRLKWEEEIAKLDGDFGAGRGDCNVLMSMWWNSGESGEMHFALDNDAREYGMYLLLQNTSYIITKKRVQ